MKELSSHFRKWQRSIRPAVIYFDFLEREKRSISYDFFFQELDFLEKFIESYHQGDQPIGIYANKSPEAYLSVLGCWSESVPFVPLHPSWPIARIERILKKLNIATILTDPVSVEKLQSAFLQNQSVFVVDSFRKSKNTRFQSIKNLKLTKTKARNFPESSLAYVIFTSGTTGEPKGIEVEFSSLNKYLNEIKKLVFLSESDVISQNYDISFDPFIGDVLWAFSHGACLRPIQLSEILNLTSIIKNDGITIWGSTPALAETVLLNEMNVLSGLRLSTFIGEKLSKKLVLSWQARGGGRVLNLYGPAETTISVSGHEFNPVTDITETVSIGKPHSGTEFAIVDSSSGQEMKEGDWGELWIGGDQLARGYIDPDLTEKKFKYKNINHFSSTRWYCTGDICRKVDGEYHIKGRIDHQVKIRGQRFELEEIESLVSKQGIRALALCRHDPHEVNTAENFIVMVVCTIDLKDKKIPELIELLAKDLPEAILPKVIYRILDWPLTSNGKIDRKKVEDFCRGNHLEKIWPE